MPQSYDEQREKIKSALREKYHFDDDFMPWIAEHFDDHVIVEMEYEKYWSIPYSITGDTVNIADRTEWNEVEKKQSWVEKRAQEARKISKKSHLVLEAKITPRTTDAEFEGREWDVTIIGPKTPEHLVEIEGREYIKSENGKLYDVEGVRASVPHVWDKIKVYDNHLTDDEFHKKQGMRSWLKEGLGAIVNPVWDDAKKSITGVFKVAERALAQKLKDAYDLDILDTIGLSIDAFAIKGPPITFEGKQWDVRTAFTEASSVDLVGNPAAGGGFNRLIAAQTTGVNNMDEELKQQIMEAVKAAVSDLVPAAVTEALNTEPPPEADEPPQDDPPAEHPPEDDEPEEADEPPQDEPVADPAETKEALRQIKLFNCQQQLNQRLTEAKLPASFEGVVRDTFKGRVYEAKELDAMIKRLKKAQAQSDQSGRVTESGDGRGVVTSAITVEDKAEAEFMRIFMGATEFKALERVANDNDFVQERMTEGYKSWLKDGRPNGYGNVKISEWVRNFYGDPFTQAPARVSEAITTSSMSSIVKNTVNIMIAADYAKRHRWWETIVRTEEVDTIDQATLVRVYGLDTLSVVNEGAAYTELNWADEEETPTFVKDGNFVGVTLEAMLSDKVQAIRTLPMRLSTSWYNTKSKRAAAVFTANSDAGPVLSDSGALFNATAASSSGGHANLLTAALSFTAYSAARTAMRKQTDQTLGNGRKLQINPAYLLVPEDLETTANQIRNTENQPGTGNFVANPFYQKFEVTVVPEWTDTDNWALVGDPMEFPAIWDIVLTGNRVPSIFSAGDEMDGAMFTNDTLRWKVRMMSFRFSATYDTLPVGDFRPLHKNNV